MHLSHGHNLHPSSYLRLAVIHNDANRRDRQTGRPSYRIVRTHLKFWNGLGMGLKSKWVQAQIEKKKGAFEGK